MRKHVKNAFMLLSALFLITSCVTTQPGTSREESESASQVVQYSITFNTNGGSPVNSITANQGANVNKPNDPTKTDNVFKGWYRNANLTEVVVWPITATSNLTLYAKWQNSRDYFLEARDATTNANQFEYNFNLNVSTTYGSFEGPEASIVGNSKYNASSNSSYFQTEVRSGLLIGDGTIYQIKTGNDLGIFKLNKDNKLINYSLQTVPSGFKYDSSSFAKALFEFSSDQITSVPSAANQKFRINFSGSFTGLIDASLTFLNHPIVDAILQQWVNLPDKDSSLVAYVTFENGFVNTYEYDFTITVAGASLTFHYDLDFIKVGSSVVINPPDFSGVAVSTEAVNTKLNLIKTGLNTYRNAAHSGYTYRLDTQVDYPNAFAIDATIQGRTMRKVSSGISYFWNHIEVDSDYKNNDLYKSQGVVDYERYRVRYANQSVFDCVDGLLSNTYTQLVNYSNGAIDSYYFLIPNTFYTTTNISTVEEKTVGGTKTYSLGLSSFSIDELLTFVDASARFDVGGGFEFDIYNVQSNLDVKTSKFDLVFTDGAFTSMVIEVQGRYVGSYAETTFAGPLDFELKLEIMTNDLGQQYEPPTKNSEVDLSNS